MSIFKYAIKIDSAERNLVDISNFHFSENKITFLFGESGIGKSMLCKALYGLLDPDDLDITINEASYAGYLMSDQVKKLQQEGFFVFQEPSSHLNPLQSLNSQLKDGSLNITSPQKEMEILRYLWSGTEDEMLAKLLKVYPKPYRPSGGEKQRILLAMAFKKIKSYIDNKEVHSKGVFIFDEPSGSLDNYYRNNFIHLLCASYKAKPFTAIVITHDYSVISEIETQLKSFSSVIEYKELNREQDKVELRNFEKQEYLDWIAKQQVVLNPDIAEKPLLLLKSGLKNFGMHYTFHRADFNNPVSDLQINKGDLIYLKARSGVGKTTIAKIILGLIKPLSLDLNFAGIQLNQGSSLNIWKRKIWGKKAAMVFQHADEALNQNVTVYNIFKVLLKRGERTKENVLKIVQQLFEVEIPVSFLDKKVKFLSGGQKQRINILRSMVLDTDFLIMDEPLNGLDLKSSHKVLEMIKQKQNSGKAILLISHNEEIFDKLVSPEKKYFLKAI